MILSDSDIRKLLSGGQMKIEPLSDEQIGQASVDLTLAGTFWKFKKEFISQKLDLAKTSYSEVMDEIHADSIELAPGELCLGITEEKISLPPDIMGRLEGRSRYARLGLAVHVTSSLVQPGSSNRQVLEIVNFSHAKLILHKGMRISQVVFQRLDSPTSKPYAQFGQIARGQ